MEDATKRPGHQGAGGAVKDPGGHGEGGRGELVASKAGHKRAHPEHEDQLSSSPESKDLSLNKQVAAAVRKETSPMELDSKTSSSSQKEEDDQLESARVEMGEVIEENQRLKANLERVMKDYRNLQRQFYDIAHQEETRKSTITVDDNQKNEEPEMVSLSLGRFSSEFKKDEKNYRTHSEGKSHEQAKESMSLGLDLEVSKSEANETLNSSPANSLEEPKEEAGETWPPGKDPKTMRNGDDEVLQQNPAKKARVCVRARCDTPTMQDGCQWRKYGQKIAKGNPCPRAYYRCTVAPSCPVRKQVQRCAEDMSILITTYEGTHNHPLPLTATAMASTTSAAASMLLSGSSSSRTGSSQSATSSTIASDLHGLNFYLSDNSKPKQFYVHNSSLSSSPSCPTITLDLTSNPSAVSSHFNRFSSSYPTIPRFSSTNLNFGSSESSPAHWGNGILSYGSASQPYNRNLFGNVGMGKSPFDANMYQSYMPKSAPSPLHQAPPDTIAAATKAITADPNFQSALVAALTSIIGTGNASASSGGRANPGGGDHNNNIAQKLKLGEQIPLATSSYSTPPKSNACATSYLNRTTPTNSQPGSLMFMPPSLPFTSPRNASASPGEKTAAISDLEMRL